MAEYIDRQALLDALPSVKEDMQISLYAAVADFIIKISTVPAADVEPVRHGHWEEAIRARRSIAGKIEGFRCYECSDCGERSLCETKYCPRCGAKMAEEGHNENSNTNTTRLL